MNEETTSYPISGRGQGWPRLGDPHGPGGPPSHQGRARSLASHALAGELTVSQGDPVVGLQSMGPDVWAVDGGCPAPEALR